MKYDLSKERIELTRKHGSIECVDLIAAVDDFIAPRQRWLDMSSMLYSFAAAMVGLCIFGVAVTMEKVPSLWYMAWPASIATGLIVVAINVRRVTVRRWLMWSNYLYDIYNDNSFQIAHSANQSFDHFIVGAEYFAQDRTDASFVRAYRVFMSTSEADWWLRTVWGCAREYNLEHRHA